MQAYTIPRKHWVFKLTPQLTGKAQQAYAAMPTANAGKYEEVKAAILRRYDINTETYRQRFRTMRLNEGETHREMATRLSDLVEKWMKECKSLKEVCEMIIIEQLLEQMSECGYMSENLRTVWKPVSLLMTMCRPERLQI